MSDPKNPFESRDLESRFDQEIDSNGGSNGGVTHRGRERRYHGRRTKADRRADIRFEIDKEDRRENPGRRLDDGVDVSR
jgi:hypothetical protein